MAKSMSMKLEFVAPLPQIAITRFTYNAVEFYGPQGPRYKEVDLYHFRCQNAYSASVSVSIKTVSKFDCRIIYVKQNCKCQVFPKMKIEMKT